MTRYDFLELREKALRTNSTEDLNALGMWFEQYGESCWNGEFFDASLPEEPSGTLELFPVYGEENDDGIPTTIGYKFR